MLGRLIKIPTQWLLEFRTGTAVTPDNWSMLGVHAGVETGSRNAIICRKSDVRIGQQQACWIGSSRPCVPHRDGVKAAAPGILEGRCRHRPGNPEGLASLVGLIVNYNHPSRTMLFMAVGTLAVGGVLAAAAVTGKPDGRVPGLVLAGVIAALALWFVFAAVWFAIRGNPFEADATTATHPHPRGRVVGWMSDHWWLLAALAVLMAALGIAEGPPYLQWDRPLLQGALPLAAAAVFWLRGRHSPDVH